MDKANRKSQRASSIKDRLINGETMPGKIFSFTERGAIVNVSGVFGYLRNRDFSDDGTIIKDKYKIGNGINVKFKSLDKWGRINLIPEKFHNGIAFFDIDEIKKGCVYVGRVTHTNPAGFEVVIDAGLYVFCQNNFTPANLYDKVIIEITHISKSSKDKKNGIRGRIIRVKKDD